MRSPTLWLLAIGLLMGCDQTATEPAPPTQHPDFAKVSNERSPLILTAQACNGEIVDITGEVHHVVTLTTTPGGSMNVSDNIQVHGTGVGQTTGVTYHLREVGNFNTRVVGLPPQSFTFVDTGGLLAQGGAESFRFKIHFHITVNADEEVTAETGILSFICK
jgi:hypothetical protein